MRTRRRIDAIDAATQRWPRPGSDPHARMPNCWPLTSAGTDRGRLASIEPDPDFVERYERLVSKRAERVPLQHLIGTAAFGPITVQVGPGVFIPRPETESLLEWALAQPFRNNAADCAICVPAPLPSPLALSVPPTQGPGHRRRRLRRRAGVCAAQCPRHLRRTARADVTDAGLLQ